MIIIVGLFGFLGCLGFFISSLIYFFSGQIGLGITMFLSALYCLAVTIVLIRTDGKSTDAENKIKKLEDQITLLKEKIGLDEKKFEPVENEENETVEGEIEPQTEGVTYCEKCGYQLFPEDKVCPNCETKIKK